MDGSRYDVDVDLSNRNNSHTLMVELVGGTKRVLDVGCSTGFLARTLVERGCTVSGLECDPESAEEARPYLTRLVVGDVEQTDLAEAFGDERFDVIVFGDVLEHLVDPLAVLRSAGRLLADRGSVVASIPNVAHGSVRLALLAGRFDYQPLGLLDSTHLRFFTRSSIEALFRDAGLVPVDVRRTTAGFFDTPLPLTEAEVSPDVVEKILTDPESTTYQFVLRAVADDADLAIARNSALEDSRRERVAELERDLAVAQAAGQEARAQAENAERRADEAEHRLAELDARLVSSSAGLASARTELETVLATRTMRWSHQARRVYGFMRRVGGVVDLGGQGHRHG